MLDPSGAMAAWVPTNRAPGARGYGIRCCHRTTRWRLVQAFGMPKNYLSQAATIYALLAHFDT